MAQRLDRIEVCSTPRREKAEDKADCARKGEGEGDHRWLDGKRYREQRRPGCGNAKTKRHANKTTEQAEHHGLDKELRQHL